MSAIKAARLVRYGGADAIRIESVSLPEPARGEALVRVHAAGVNPMDWKLRAGQMKEMHPLELPVTLGGDFSGIVEAIGPGVAGLAVGADVYGQALVTRGASGSFAEAVIAPAHGTARKPRTLDHLHAAALPLVGASALQALVDHLHLAAGQRVLIHGGAGGIGSIAVQLAKHIGAHVVATVTAADVEYVRRLGADETIDYETQKFEEVVRDLDAVFDTVGGSTYVRSFRVLKRGGRLVSMLERPREDLVRQFGVESIAQVTEVTSERLARLAGMVDSGAVKVDLDRSYPLDQAGAALEHLEKDKPRGKVVLAIG